MRTDDVIMEKEDIRNLTYSDLVKYFEVLGEKPFRAKQVFEWIYQNGVWSFAEIINLPRDLRERLSEYFILGPMTISQKAVSNDRTTKFLFDLRDNEKIETVLIPTATRTTVCVPTHAGCKFGCKFCASGIGGWKRNLSAAEILTQVLHVKEEAVKHKKPLSHIVFMGIDEPMDTVALRC